MIRNTLPVIVVVLLASSRPALAQSQGVSGASISGGFAAPMDFGNERIEPAGGDELTGGFVAPGIWGEVAFFPSSRLSLHTGIDVPASYDTRWRHVGTAGFDTHIKHNDIVVSQAIGFRPRSTRRTQLIPLVGFGLVFARSETSTTFPPFSSSGREPTRRIETNIDPSVLGGLNLSVALNRRVGMIARIRARATLRSDDSPDAHFGWFNVAPLVGITFR